MGEELSPTHGSHGSHAPHSPHASHESSDSPRNTEKTLAQSLEAIQDVIDHILKDLEALFENLSSKPDLFQFQNPTLPLGNYQNMERWLARLIGGSARSSITKSSAIHNMLNNRIGNQDFMVPPARLGLPDRTNRNWLPILAGGFDQEFCDRGTGVCMKINSSTGAVCIGRMIFGLLEPVYYTCT